MSNNDLFINLLLKDVENVRATMFHYVGHTKFTAQGETRTLDISIPGSDFLLRDIVIHAYDKWGSLYGIGYTPRDRFTFMMENTTSGEKYFSSATDVLHFSPISSNQSRIVPGVMPANSVLKFEITHAPIIRNAPINDQALDFSENGGVHFEVILVGAKLFTNRKQ